jgi:hypothetical protein
VLSFVIVPSYLIRRMTSSIAAAAAAKKQADAVQVPILFAQRDPYPIGMKVLLPETIYHNAAAVRSL